MNAPPAETRLAVGADILGPVRVMTAERIQWYDSAMLSAAKGELARVTVNIHTDDDYARSQGLPAIIADGMISTNWCSEMLIQQFGMDYVERGHFNQIAGTRQQDRTEHRTPGPGRPAPPRPAPRRSECWRLRRPEPE